MIDWLIYWFMFPACILIASVAMLTGISGTAMLTPFLILVFPILSVPILTMQIERPSTLCTGNDKAQPQLFKRMPRDSMEKRR